MDVSGSHDARRSCRGHGGAAYWWLLFDFNLILAWQHSLVCSNTYLRSFNDDTELLKFNDDTELLKLRKPTGSTRSRVSAWIKCGRIERCYGNQHADRTSGKQWLQLLSIATDYHIDIYFFALRPRGLRLTTNPHIKHLLWLVQADGEPSGDHQMVSARLMEQRSGIPNFHSHIPGVRFRVLTECEDRDP